MEIDPTSTVAVRALDGLFQRQMALVHNIANANSPGFAPVRVSFESALKQAYALARQSGDFAQVAASSITRSIDAGQPVRLDLEISSAAENAMQYSMLLSMVDRQLQVMSLAVREGRAS